MPAETLDAGIEVPWAAADEVYGKDPGLRDLCEERGVGYVLGVACSFRVPPPSGAKILADEALAKVPARPGRSPHAEPDPKETAATPGPGSPPTPADPPQPSLRQYQAS